MSAEIPQQEQKIEQPIEVPIINTEANEPKVFIEPKKEEAIESKLEGLRQEADKILSTDKPKKRKSSVTKIIGKNTPIPREEIMQRIEEFFCYQPLRGQWKKEQNRWGSMIEREKTNEELEIINIVNNLTNELLDRYGLDRFDIPPENIHIMKRSFVLRLYEFLSLSKKQGRFDQSCEAGEVIDPGSKMELAKTTLHEMIHFKSYNSIQKEVDEKGWMGTYRLGLEVHSRDGKNIYFRGLNEAITEELTVRILPQVVENSILKDEKNKLNKYPSYEKEREFLHGLMNNILRQNPDKFKNTDDVFEVFSRAMMTGNILALGRLIEKTFGKGSFRMFGEL